MKIPFIIGQRIDFYVLDKEEHLPSILKWLNSTEMYQVLTTGIMPMDVQFEERYFEKRSGDKDNVVFAIHLKDGLYIGNVGIHHIDWVSRTAEPGIVIGDPDARGKGYGTEAERMLIDYAFNRLNLLKLEAKIFAHNKASLNTAKKLGCQFEGTLKKHIYKNGEHRDVFLVSFFKEDWKKA